MTRPAKTDPLPTTFVVICDTREARPFRFEGLFADAKDGNRPLLVRTERRGLASGDYSLAGYADRVAIERKSLADLLSTLGQERERFERELARLDQMEHALVVVEASWHQVLDLVPSCLVDLAAWLDSLSAHCGREEEQNGQPGRTRHPRPIDEWYRALISMLGPQTYSQLNRKTVHRSILAWRQRYPRVHWDLCGDRQLAEITTFRTLERYWKEQQHAATKAPAEGIDTDSIRDW